jgi:DNA-binding transcriptional regulator YhcF (GntR family)
MKGQRMTYSIDMGSATPPYEQIRVQVRDAVAAGTLAAGAKLPTVRALAAELGLAVNTAARAYRELETDGIIETRGRFGSFVAQHGDPTQQQAHVAAREFVARARRLGLDDASALALVRAAQRG